MNKASELAVLYCDNHLLVVDKPAGVATMGSPIGEPTVARWAADFLKQKYAKPGNVFVGIVSRLDRLVSGVLVLARTSKAASRLSEQFRQQSPAKRYLAIVEGDTFSAKWVEIVDFVAKDESTQRMRLVESQHRNAQLARLRVRRLAGTNACSLVEIELLTGRKHQIRVQLSAANSPIVGDKKYDAHKKFPVGIALHCHALTIHHPTLKESMTFRTLPARHWAGIAEEFKLALSRLD